MSGATDWPYFLQLLDLLAREGRLQRDDLIRAVEPDFDALVFSREPVGSEAREAILEATVGRLADELLDEHQRHKLFDREAENRAAGVAACYVLHELLQESDLRTAAIGQLTIGVLDSAITRPQATALVLRLHGEFLGATSDEPTLRWLLLESDGGEPS
jgi:hypothetical protein